MRCSQVLSAARGWNPGQAAPRAQQRLLQRVVGVMQVAEHAIGVHVQRAAVRAGEFDEGLLVAVAGGGEQPVQAAGGVGHGPPSSVQGDARWAPTSPPIATYWMPSGAGHDPPVLAGRDARHRAGPQLEGLVVGEQRRRPASGM